MFVFGKLQVVCRVEKKRKKNERSWSLEVFFRDFKWQSACILLTFVLLLAIDSLLVMVYAARSFEFRFGVCCCCFCCLEGVYKCALHTASVYFCCFH